LKIRAIEEGSGCWGRDEHRVLGDGEVSNCSMKIVSGVNHATVESRKENVFSQYLLPVQHQCGKSQLAGVSSTQIVGKSRHTRPSFVSCRSIRDNHANIKFLCIVLCARYPGLSSCNVCRERTCKANYGRRRNRELENRGHCFAGG
jgi:hypothetical protein